MNTKNVSVITPKLCGGYRLPSKSKDSIAIYHPAINQIWISEPVSEEDLALIHAHEAMHMQTTSLQPSQLLLLRAELLGFVDRPGTDCFDEIVETVCEAWFWSQTRLAIEHIPYMIEDAKYPNTLSALFELSQKIVTNNDKDLAKEKALKEAVDGICLLLMHIIPQQPNTGLKLIQTIAELPLPNNCQNGWAIFQDLYVKLNVEWQKTNELKELFTLMLPKDSHRFVSDMVIFLFGASKVVHSKPETITAVFPVLLSLITQARFVLLPIIYIRKIKKKYEAEIKLVHSTSTSNEELSEIISLQQVAFIKSKEKGILCGAASVFTSLINESILYRTSGSKDRIYKCFGYLLEILPDLLKKHILAENNCPGCCAVFQGDIFESAIEAIIKISEGTRQKMIQSAKEYDKFLTTGAMDIIQDAWNLNSAPQAFRSYDFL